MYVWDTVFMEVTRDALLLDGWVTVGIKQVGRDREITAKYIPEPKACTEALNGVTKVANRMGRGYTFPIIRARVLFKNLPDEIDMTPRYYHSVPGTRTPRQATYDWPQCMSCLAEYPPSQMTVDSLPFPEGHVRQMALLCPECLDRFHGHS